MLKRWIYMFVTMVTLLLMIFASPTSANSSTNDVSSYQDFLAQLQNSIDHFETTASFQVDPYDENVLDLKRAYKELSLRDPAAEFITTLSAEYHFDTKSFVIRFNYDYDSDECARLYAAAMRKVDVVSKEIFKPGMSDYEKIRSAHDYVVNHVQYDDAGRENLQGHEYENLFTTAVLERKAVCGGYSWMLKVLLDRVGIGSQIVIGTLDRGDGTSAGHAWNIVWLNGKTYQVDVTNDDLESLLPSYGYFMVDDQVMAKNHEWERDVYPPCVDGTYEYYLKNKLWVADSKTAVALLKERMKDRGKLRTESAAIVFRVLYPEAFENKWVEDLVTQAAIQSNPKWVKYNYEYVLQGDIRYIRIFKVK